MPEVLILSSCHASAGFSTSEWRENRTEPGRNMLFSIHCIMTLRTLSHRSRTTVHRSSRF
ncbi:hypothetical protein AALO_G00123180 [Alosa alosa]|uniref:Uncharacterized protein n=1 Tax=Alosa alosa TaxID=278164 RepID=A0AAV6GMI0_9TELE|nr:hypothetical protein AALO_G00123180 [Alosa alosa]